MGQPAPPRSRMCRTKHRSESLVNAPKGAHFQNAEVLHSTLDADMVSDGTRRNATASTIVDAKHWHQPQVLENPMLEGAIY